MPSQDKHASPGSPSSPRPIIKRDKLQNSKSCPNFKSLRSQPSLPTYDTKSPSPSYNIRCPPEHASIKEPNYEPSNEPQLERHVDLWFEDGSVICQAENTLFKVHMFLLARHSVCFRNMFSMPQPETNPGGPGEPCGGQFTRDPPIICLHDSAEDVRNLFTALYDGPNFGNNDQDDFRIVSGILRLSTKYIIDFLRAKAIAHLNIAWPSSLEGWDTREDIARSHEASTTLSNTHRYPHPISVINLAREVNAPSLLPAAFYDLSRYPYTQIFEPSEDDPTFRPSSFPPPHLSIVDMQRLCLGKEAAQHMITTFITAIGSRQYVRSAQLATHRIRKTSSSGICFSAAACRKEFSELVDLATQHFLFDRERGCCDPLYIADELGQLKSTDDCKACAKSLEAWAARERERMWKLIPLWFRLDPPMEGSPKSVQV